MAAVTTCQSAIGQSTVTLRLTGSRLQWRYIMDWESWQVDYTVTNTASTSIRVTVTVSRSESLWQPHRLGDQAQAAGSSDIQNLLPLPRLTAAKIQILPGPGTLLAA